MARRSLGHKKMIRPSVNTVQQKSHLRKCLNWCVSVCIVCLIPVGTRLIQGHTLERWAVVMLLCVLLSSSMSLLLVVVPHAAIARLVAVWLTILAGGNAIVLAVFTFSGAENSVLTGLDLSDEFLLGNGLAWTGLMTLHCVAASFATHLSTSATNNLPANE